MIFGMQCSVLVYGTAVIDKEINPTNITNITNTNTTNTINR